MRTSEEIIAHVRRGIVAGKVDLKAAEELCARAEQILSSALKMETYVHDVTKILEKTLPKNKNAV